MKPEVSKRAIAIGRARVAGYHGDTASYSRQMIERGRAVSQAALAEAFRSGAKMRVQGVPCNCHNCHPTK